VDGVSAAEKWLVLPASGSLVESGGVATMRKREPNAAAECFSSIEAAGGGALVRTSAEIGVAAS
jgi:hypothetical protein